MLLLSLFLIANQTRYALLTQGTCQMRVFKIFFEIKEWLNTASFVRQMLRHQDIREDGGREYDAYMMSILVYFNYQGY